MGILIHDVRHGVRSLLKTPGLTAAAILSLGLGIGANTTIFTWVKAVLLRPVPGASDPASLYVAVVISRDGIRDAWSYPDYRDIRDRADVLPIAQADFFLTSLSTDRRSVLTARSSAATTSTSWVSPRRRDVC